MILETTAVYYDGISSQQHRVTVSLYNDMLQLHGETAGTHSCSLSELKVAPRVGAHSLRIIHLPAGAKLELEGDELIDAINRQRPVEGRMHSIAYLLESKWRYVLLAVGLMIALVWSFYVWTIPWAAKKVAFALPTTTNNSLSDGAMKIFDKYLFGPSKLPETRRAELSKYFSHIVSQASTRDHYRLLFRGGGKIGANAFALPSGTVVVTDELIKLARHDNEIIAVLAHEVGHINKRHSMRIILQTSISALFISLVTGDVTASSALAASLPTVLIHSKFSRQFETEADDYALQYLLRNKISPMAFVNIMNRIEAAVRSGGKKPGKVKTGKGKVRISDYVSSHPRTSKRNQRFIDAAKKAGFR